MSLRIRSAALAAVLSIAAFARADEERARAYLDAAKEDIKNGNPDSVERSLELMEEQFDGIPDAVKNQLKSEGERLKKLAVEKKAESIYVDAEKKLTELEKDRDMKRQLANAQAKPTDADAIANLGSMQNSYRLFKDNDLKALPPDNPRTQALSDRLEKWAAPMNKLLMASERQGNLDALKGLLTQVKSAEAEAKKTDPPQPDFATWGQGVEEIVAKKSLTLASGIYQNLEENKAFESAFADDAEISGIFKQMHQIADTAAARVIGDTNKVVDAAETAPPNNWDVPGKLHRARTQLEKLNGAAGRDELAARITTLLDRWEKGDSDRMAAHAKAIDDLESSAKSTWPDIVAQYSSDVVEVDPAEALADIGKFKGKLVRFENKANVAGTAFGAPEFAYVATIDGKPFACKFSRKGLAAADKYSQWNDHRPISLDDFRDVVARVTGTGKVNVLSKNTITDQFEVIGQVDVPVAEIVAFQSRYVTFDESKGSNVDTLK